MPASSIKCVVSTVSYNVLFGSSSYVSARHCQEGQGATVYKPVPYTLTSEPVGGRKIRKRITKKRRTKKRITKKRIITNKRRINKKQTKRRRTH